MPQEVVPRALRRIGLLAAILTAFILCAPAALADVPQGYAVFDLGTLGGPYTTAAGVNYQGQVVGSSTLPSGLGAKPKAFLWSPGAGMTNMHLGRDVEDQSVATGINDAGQVAADLITFDQYGNAYSYAYIWTGGTFAPRGVPQGYGYHNPYVRTLNATGSAAGNFGLPGGGFRAVLWAAGAQPKDLGTLVPDGSGASDAWSINGPGQVVGESSFPGAIRHAFLYDGTMTDLGTLPDTRDSYAYGINDAAQVVGTAMSESGVYTAFLWDPAGGMQELAGVAGRNMFAWSINNNGVTVGQAGAYPQNSSPVLWDSDGTLYNLRDWVAPSALWNGDSAAAAIDDSGDVIVNSVHAYLLRPLIVSSIGFNPNPVQPGGTTTVTITLNGKAPPTGVIVSLSSSDPATANVPDSVTIASDHGNATFNITIDPNATAASVDITASLDGVDTTETLQISQ